MAGHSHWAGIKRQKGANDKKRGVVFSKLLKAITAAAKTESNPDFNPRLRTAVEKARAANVPNENISRAIQRATEPDGGLDELLFEAYGPGGIAVLIEVVSDSRNRAVAEVKKILADNNGKWAEAGSVLWAFEQAAEGGERWWQPKFPQEMSNEDAEALGALVEALEAHDDVIRVSVGARETT